MDTRLEKAEKYGCLCSLDPHRAAFKSTSSCDNVLLGNMNFDRTTATVLGVALRNKTLSFFRDLDERH